MVSDVFVGSELVPGNADIDDVTIEEGCNRKHDCEARILETIPLFWDRVNFLNPVGIH